MSELLHEAEDLITPELIQGFGVDKIQAHYETIARKISQIEKEKEPFSLLELTGEINSLMNYNLSLLGNPKGIKGYSELCVLYKKLNSHFEKELASIPDRLVPFRSGTLG